jgi:integrase
MKTHKDKKRKPWKVEKIGNVSIPIYRRNKLHKASGKRYEVFEVSDYTAGIRTLHSLSNSAKAIAEAQRIAKLISTGQNTAATMRNSDAASYGRAVELLRGIDVPLELAAGRYAEAYKILGGDKIIEAARDFIRRNPTERPARTIAEVVTELVELKKKRGAGSRYAEDLKSRLDKFGERFASIRVDRVTTTDIQGWLDGMDAKPRTVRNFRSNVSTLFKYAEARGYIGKGENPVTATEQITSRNTEAITIYSPEELVRLLNAAPDWFKPIIAIQAFAGLRSAEVMRLDWRDVKLDRGHIEVSAQQAKTASRRLVPITPNLSEWLEPFAARKGKMFPHCRAYFHEAQRDTAAATAIKADAKKHLAAKDALEWKHNALRHSFISYRVADVQNVAQVALEAGNSPAMIFAHYREVVDAGTAKAWFGIAPKQPANVTSLKGAKAP